MASKDGTKKHYRLIYTPLEADGTLLMPTDKEIYAENEEEAKAMAKERFEASGIPEALQNGDLCGILFFLMDGRRLVRDFLWEHTDRQPRFNQIYLVYHPELDKLPYSAIDPYSKAVACLSGGIKEALVYASYDWQAKSPKEKLECRMFELCIGDICIRDFVAEQREETAYIKECMKRRL